MVSQHRQAKLNKRKGIEPDNKPKQKEVKKDDNKSESRGNSE